MPSCKSLTQLSNAAGCFPALSSSLAAEHCMQKNGSPLTGSEGHDHIICLSCFLPLKTHLLRLTSRPVSSPRAAEPSEQQAQAVPGQPQRGCCCLQPPGWMRSKLGITGAQFGAKTSSGHQVQHWSCTGRQAAERQALAIICCLCFAEPIESPERFPLRPQGCSSRAEQGCSLAMAGFNLASDCRVWNFTLK